MAAMSGTWPSGTPRPPRQATLSGRTHWSRWRAPPRPGRTSPVTHARPAQHSSSHSRQGTPHQPRILASRSSITFGNSHGPTPAPRTRRSSCSTWTTSWMHPACPARASAARADFEAQKLLSRRWPARRRVQKTAWSPNAGRRVALVETLIHRQDIRRALGRPRHVPAERLPLVPRLAMIAPDIAGPWRIRGVRLVATDLRFSAGAGPQVPGVRPTRC